MSNNATAANTLAVKSTETHVAEIVHHGDKLILPELMTVAQAIDLLQRRLKYLEEKVQVVETFDVFPWDGAYALDVVLTRRFGWSPAEKIRTMFGDKPPTMVSIDIDYDKVIQVPWGKFSIPGTTAEITTGTNQKDGRFCFHLQGICKRTDEHILRSLYAELRLEMRSNSIYRGKAFKLRFLDENGEQLHMPEPKFMDTKSIDERMLVYSSDVREAIETNLFTPIQRVADCKANGLPVKRGVLLGGTYGTGKTMAAHVASKYAVQCGVTFIYVQRADELALALNFSKQYQDPACVVFCEDIDRVMRGGRSIKMDDILNTIDGIDSKNSNVLVVLTTNNLEDINPATLRPGRLDAVIEVLPPDAKAIEQLLRLYAMGTIPEDADLTEAGELLAGNIPAVVAEVVKRAKLAQLRRQEPGTKVVEIKAEALVESARTMATQLRLLNGNKSPIDQETLDTILEGKIDEALKPVNRMLREINEKV